MQTLVVFTSLECRWVYAPPGTEECERWRAQSNILLVRVFNYPCIGGLDGMLFWNEFEFSIQDFKCKSIEYFSHCMLFELIKD